VNVLSKDNAEMVWTDDQLKKKIKRLRSMITIIAPGSLKPKKDRFGEEVFLATDEGEVRVLTYNMDNPAALPLLINIHGSGFTIGSADMDDPFMPNLADKANVKIISVDYKLAPEYPFPKSLNECYAVIRYAKEHPEEFGIDPDRIAISGFSAGGNFAAAIGIMESGKNLLGLKCLSMNYPPLDVYTDSALKPRPKMSIPVFMSRMFDACYLNDKEARKNPLVSPVYATDEQLRGFPPTLIITANGDSLCEEGAKFSEMLANAGVDVTYKVFKGMHGFDRRSNAEADASWQMVIGHLKKYL